MRIEQAAELNKHVDETIPLTWAVRLKMFRLVCPLLLLCSVQMMEIVLIRLWLSGRSFTDLVWLLLAAGIFPFALVFIATELTLRLHHRTKRTLELEKDAITITPSKISRVPSERVYAWWLEPVPMKTELRKFTVDYSPDKKGDSHRVWSMVLTQPDQTQALRLELDGLRLAGRKEVPLIELLEPRPRMQPPRSRSMWLIAAAMYLLVHGMPLLFTGFSSARSRLRGVFLVAGAAFTAVGAVLWICAFRLMRRHGMSRQLPPLAPTREENLRPG